MGINRQSAEQLTERDYNSHKYQLKLQQDMEVKIHMFSHKLSHVLHFTGKMGSKYTCFLKHS